MNILSRVCHLKTSEVSSLQQVIKVAMMAMMTEGDEVMVMVVMMMKMVVVLSVKKITRDRKLWQFAALKKMCQAM